MTKAEEKGRELIEKFRTNELYAICEHEKLADDLAKACALICVDEIINVLAKELGNTRGAWAVIDEYKKVKQFINNPEK